MTREGMILTPEAQADREYFESVFQYSGCLCFAFAPCLFCTDPGNPVNQEENDDCWTTSAEIKSGAKKVGCGYQGRHFGAYYEDATCVNGYLWDLDSSDEEGLLGYGGDIPCPQCNTKEFAADYHVSGNAKQRRAARRKVARAILEKTGK